LDGNRLLVTSGTYGASGSKYSTEEESFAIVTANGTSGNGPTWFSVVTKDGSVLEYGNTENSRIEVSGTSDILMWRLNKMTDANVITSGLLIRKRMENPIY
jgi:hypothetical protein